MDPPSDQRGRQVRGVARNGLTLGQAATGQLDGERRVQYGS